MPQLSVLMPVKNGEQYLAPAIRSTLMAMPRDSELVIADDGSTDGTPQVIDGFRDKRLRIVSWATSKGVAASLNQLLSLSDSKFIARMDADDICLPFRFKYQAAIVASYDCVFSSVVPINAKGLPTRPQIPGRIGPSALPIHLLMGNVLVHPTMFAQRSFIDSLGGYNLTPAEDYDLWLRGAAADKKMIRSAIPTLLYRKHDAQVSASGGWLNDSWDPNLDDSFIKLAAKFLDFQVTDNSIRKARSSGNGNLVSDPTREKFSAALARAIKNLSPSERIQAHVRLRSMQSRSLLNTTSEE